MKCCKCGFDIRTQVELRRGKCAECGTWLYLSTRPKPVRLRWWRPALAWLWAAVLRLTIAIGLAGLVLLGSPALGLAGILALVIVCDGKRRTGRHNS